MAPTPASLGGRAILERATVHVPDIRTDPTSGHRGFRRLRGERSSVYRCCERARLSGCSGWGEAISPVHDRQIALLETFADQAVIAIENVRLFKELEARTHDLTRSVNELRALGEVGRAVSSTLDLQTVLTTIVTRAVQLSGTDGGVIYEYDEGTEAFRLRASHQVRSRAGARCFERAPFRPGEGVTGRAAALRGARPGSRHRRRAELRESDPARSRRARLSLDPGRAAPAGGARSIGALTVWRQAAGGFAPKSCISSRPSRPSPPWPSRTPACSARSRTRAGSSRPPAATSPSSSPTCPTSSGPP